MFVTPLFDTDMYLDPANSMDFALANINHLLYKSNQISTSELAAFIEEVVEDHKDEKYELIYFSIPFNDFPDYAHDEFY